MDSFGNNNFVKSSSFTQASAPTAPPPPSEVKVRTMRSDLASMAKSGGGLPRFENVKVSGLSLEKSGDGTGGTGGNRTMILLIVAVAVIGAGIIGYLVYKIFFTH